MSDEPLYTYHGFYAGKQYELKATSLYAAKQAAVAHFKVKPKQAHMVSVVLVGRPDGSEVVHTAD